MNKNSKVVLVLALAFLSLNANAQYSIQAGYLKSDNIAKAAIGGTSVTTNNSGFYVGLNAAWPIARIENLYYEGGILYSYLGDKNGDVTENIHLLNFPLHLKYQYDVTPQIGIFGFAGPTASIGLAAHDKDSSTSVSLYGDNGILNRVDLKLGIGGGLEFSKKLAVRIGYDWGLFNMSKIENVKMNLNYFHVGIAYNL